MRRPKNGMPTASVARRLGTLNGENQMNDQQFEALLSSLSELTKAIKSHTNEFKDEMLSLQLVITDFRNSYEIVNDIDSEIDLDNLDSPIGGDGE